MTTRLATRLTAVCRFTNPPKHITKAQTTSFIRAFSQQHNDDDVLARVKVAPIRRQNESLETKKARLVYQSRKRGILETDLLLSRFAAKYLKAMTPEQLEEYDALLNELDWDIYYWATKNYETTPLPDRWKHSQVLEMLQEFSKNKDKEILRMPELDKY